MGWLLVISFWGEKPFVGNPFARVPEAVLLPNGTIGVSRSRRWPLQPPSRREGAPRGAPSMGLERDPCVSCLAPWVWKLLYSLVSCNFHPFLLLNITKHLKLFHVSEVSVLSFYSSAFGDFPLPFCPRIISGGTTNPSSFHPPVSCGRGRELLLLR